MPSVGFLIQSYGIGPASIARVHVAVAREHLDRRGNLRDLSEQLVSFSDAGSSGTGLGPVLMGHAATAEFAGHQFPDRYQGKDFPADLAGKYIRIEVEGGVNLGGRMRIVFCIDEDRGNNGVRTVYQWEGLIPIITSFFGGVSAEGTAQRRDLSQGTARGDYNTVMRIQAHQRAG